MPDPLTGDRCVFAPLGGAAGEQVQLRLSPAPILAQSPGNPSQEAWNLSLNRVRGSSGAMPSKVLDLVIHSEDDSDWYGRTSSRGSM